MNGRILVCPFSGRMAGKAESLWLPAGVSPIEVDAALFGESRHLAEVVATLVPQAEIIQYSPDGSDAVCACFRTSAHQILITRSLVRAELANAILNKMRPFWVKYRSSTGMIEASIVDSSPMGGRIAIVLSYSPVPRPNRGVQGVAFSKAAIVEQLRELDAKGVRHGDVTERWLPSETGANVPPLLGIGLAPLYECWRRAALAEREQIASQAWVLTDVPFSPIGRIKTDPRFYSSIEMFTGNPASLEDDIAAVGRVFEALGRVSGGMLPKEDPLRSLHVTGKELICSVLGDAEGGRGGRKEDSDGIFHRAFRWLSWKLVAGLEAGVVVAAAVLFAIFTVQKTPDPWTLQSIPSSWSDVIEVGETTAADKNELKDTQVLTAAPKAPPTATDEPVATRPAAPENGVKPLAVNGVLEVYSVKGKYGPLENRPEIEFEDRRFESWQLKQVWGRNKDKYLTTSEMRIHFDLSTPLFISAKLDVKSKNKDLDLILIRESGEKDEEELCFADKKLASRVNDECPSLDKVTNSGLKLLPGKYRLVVLAPDIGDTKSCGPDSGCEFELKVSFAK